MAVMIKVDLDDQIVQKLSAIENNERILLACHNTLARMCDPYVPMQQGVLAQSIQISKDGVTYTQPYAHYQYVGEVYGPSWPIIQDGVIVGWRSPKGEGTKHPTGGQLSYSKEMHPLATHHWDQAMMRDHGDEFKAEIAKIIKGEWLRGSR